ncbi:hypothetical protein GGR53DRAFT_465806 [Hypoxylon sp. FL1150]|nr:hypothetical protein GGR53DRAFT_465806 [Hypoxylon sp. FL1150]
MPWFNPYWALGLNHLEPDISMQEVHHKHRDLSLWFYPNKSNRAYCFGMKGAILGKPDVERYAEIQEAFRILFNEDLKAKYDKIVKDLGHHDGEKRYCLVCERRPEWLKSLRSQLDSQLDSNVSYKDLFLKTQFEIVESLNKLHTRCDKFVSDTAPESPHLLMETIERADSFFYALDDLQVRMTRLEDCMRYMEKEGWEDPDRMRPRIGRLFNMAHHAEFLEMKLSDLNATVEALEETEPDSKEAENLVKQFRVQASMWIPTHIHKD